MIRINPGASEKRKRKLNKRSLVAAVSAIANDGMVVLEQVVSHAVLDKLKARMDEDTRELQAFHDAHSGNLHPPNSDSRQCSELS